MVQTDSTGFEIKGPPVRKKLLAGFRRQTCPGFDVIYQFEENRPPGTARMNAGRGNCCCQLWRD